MKFSDIVDLAKAGYKPSDIKELLTLKEPEDKQEPEGDKKVQKSTEPDEPDYKTLYEAEKKKLEELQDKNSREPQPEPEKIEDVIKNIRKSIS